MDTPRLDYIVPWLQEEVDAPNVESALNVEGVKSHTNLLQDIGQKKKNDWRILWDAFLSHKKPGDKIHYFQSDDLSWKQFAGRAGFVIVRDGKPVKTFTTRMS